MRSDSPAYEKILELLVGRGHFPKELPPVFTTSDLSQHVGGVLDAWEQGNVFARTTKNLLGHSSRKPKAGAYLYRIDETESELISKPKRGYERRNIHVTHPIPQVLLAQEIAANWRSLQRHLQRQKYSLDSIVVSSRAFRALQNIEFRAHRAKKSFISATSDWLVKTDISRFYPSIYTHSITWALYGKETVKTNRKTYSGSFGDRLDILVRACNRNQTIGIPIGPETSRIIAEVISARIDNSFYESEAAIGLDQSKIDRLQDDWFLGVESLEKAETVLSALIKSYRNYGLEINGSKTSIEHILGGSETAWISEIGSFLSHKTGQLSGKRLQELLSLSLRLQIQFPSEPVVNYALAIIEGKKLNKSDIEPLESFLLKSAIISPISNDVIARILINMDYQTGAISKERIKDRFETLVYRNLENGNHFEALWQIYALRGLKIPVTKKGIPELIEHYEGSSIPLVALDMKAAGLHPRKLPTETWESRINAADLKRAPLWLLAYESFRKGWLNDSKGRLSDPFLKSMSDRDIVFYDPKKNVPSSKSLTRKRWAARQVQNQSVLKLMNELRGFHIEFPWEDY